MNWIPVTEKPHPLNTRILAQFRSGNHWLGEFNSNEAEVVAWQEVVKFKYRRVPVIADLRDGPVKVVGKDGVEHTLRAIDTVAHPTNTPFFIDGGFWVREVFIEE